MNLLCSTTAFGIPVLGHQYALPGGAQQKAPIPLNSGSTNTNV